MRDREPSVPTFDRVVVGAGMFGLYAAWLMVRQGLSVAVIDADAHPMNRASFVNQARLHLGYHYPRSVYTAARSATYFHRFAKDFSAAVNDRFDQIYAISSAASHTDADGFERFLDDVAVPADRVDPNHYFREGTVSAAWSTPESGFDAGIIRDLMLERLHRSGPVTWFLGRAVRAASRSTDAFVLELSCGGSVQAEGVVNATYAGANTILDSLGYETLSLKYELCEVAIVQPQPELAHLGITVMDGPFFSIMPFGHTGLHTLTAVDYTPRRTSLDPFPVFPCQAANPACSPVALDNCASCPARPESARLMMNQLARKYLAHRFGFAYEESLFVVKTVLETAEVDDSRPTLILVHDEEPLLMTILSGKINTIYDLEEAL